MRTSPPAALTESRSVVLPGTRSMSPNEQKITSGRAAISSALSISSTGVTQTGQPGPWMSVICLGSSSSRPNLTMAWVWPPQTSMSDQGRVVMRAISCAYLCAASASRYSSRYFIGGGGGCRGRDAWGGRRDACATFFKFAQLLHLAQILEDLLGLGFIHAAEGEADMDDDVIADLGLGHVGEADFLEDAAEINFAGAHQRVFAADAGDFAWNCQTHCS